MGNTIKTIAALVALLPLIACAAAENASDPDGAGAAALYGSAVAAHDTAAADPPAVRSPAPDESLAQDPLVAVKDQVMALSEELLEKHGVQILLAGVQDGHVILNLRSYGDVEREIGEAELEAIRASLYEHVGFNFPLEIGIRDCCRSEAGLTGKIAAIDAAKRQVLIIDESRKNGNTDDPVATFATLAPDGVIIIAGGNEPATFADLSVGQQVRAWSTGLMLQSYPGQTIAVKIEIVE